MVSFTLSEVRKHRNKTDLWVICDSQVYDVTKFSEKHPGGSDVLCGKAGQDISDVMGDEGLHRHSEVAYQILNKYRIGELRTIGETRTDTKIPCGKNKQKNSDDTDDMEPVDADWREDEFIDWDQPLVWQVGNLGKHYMKWVHTPVDKRIRFFQSDICEYLSSCSWWVVPLVWLPVMAIYLYSSFVNFQLVGEEVWFPIAFGGKGFAVDVFSMPMLFIVGAFMWSFLEYIIHRWFFHLEPPSTSKLLITLHFLIHGQHHKAPMDRDRLVFPPVPATVFAVTIIFLYTSCFPRAMAQCLLAGTALGYTIYDLMHYYLHHGDPKIQYMKNLKNYHVRHHYVDQKKGFGISSKFWDYPFGTLIPEPSDSTRRN